jgi:hypothetical protein
MWNFTTRDSCKRIFTALLADEPILGQMPSKAVYTKIRDDSVINKV